MATLGEKANQLSSKPRQSLNIKDCSMNSVVVYKDRAEVKRVASISIGEGETEIIVTGLSEAVDGDSVRVEGQGSATILDVIYSTEEDKTEVDSNKTECENIHKSLLEQIKEKDREIKHLEFRHIAIEKQKEFLDCYSKQVIEIEQQLKKDNPSDSFSSLVDPNTVSTVLEFMKQYENRVASLDERLLELQNSKKKLTEEKKVLVFKAAEIDPKKKKDKSETIRTIKITLGAVEKCDVMLILSYVVSDASWTPAYDIRVFTKDKSMKLHYYGMIKQSTGENWENANISLSTAQPDIGGSAPQLGIHHIGFVRPRALAVMKSRNSAFVPHSYAEEYDPTIEDSLMDLAITCDLQKSVQTTSLKKLGGKRRRSYSPPPMEVEVAEVESGQLYNTTYKIPRTSNIPADNTEHKVTVAIIDLSPDFSYISVPKKSPLSFLQAKVKNNSSYAFLTGPANVFLDNNFLAKTKLTDTSPGEEFTSSLGVDQSIRITTQPVTVVRGTTGRLTKNNLITYTHVYTVKNTQANTIKLKVMDQFPLSSDERLKVIMINPDIKKQGMRVQFSHGSVFLNDDNNIEWVCTIPQDTEINLKLMFSVEFPPNDIVEGLQS